MTSPNTLTDSDSVNLGSNPSSPASTYADKSGLCRGHVALEQSEKSERTAHIGRTEPGTLIPTDRVFELRAEFTTLRNRLDPDHDFEKQTGMTILVNRLELMLKHPDDEELHGTFPALCAEFVQRHGGFR